MKDYTLLIQTQFADFINLLSHNNYFKAGTVKYIHVHKEMKQTSTQ